MILGTKVTLRTGKEYEVPSLSFGDVRRFKKDGTLDRVPLNGLTVMAGSEEIQDAAITVLHAALLANYPDLKREEVEAELDLGNTERAMEAVMATSGLKRREGDGGPEGKTP
jgi:hypothetical protein